MVALAPAVKKGKPSRSGRTLIARKTAPSRLRDARCRGGCLPCRKKFLRFFPGGFGDETYIDWERDYKELAAKRWQDDLSAPEMRRLIRAKDYAELAKRAVRIESRTNLLFSYEKMALRDAVRTPAGAKAFATALYAFLHGPGSDEKKFNRWVDAVAALPRREGGTRILTWPMVTVFGFLAQPEKHFFFKPTVTRLAAREYGCELDYASRPNWQTYSSLLDLAAAVKRDLKDMRPPPRDMIDIQSFLWVQGSEEYEE